MAEETFLPSVCSVRVRKNVRCFVHPMGLWCLADMQEFEMWVIEILRGEIWLRSLMTEETFLPSVCSMRVRKNVRCFVHPMGLWCLADMQEFEMWVIEILRGEIWLR